MRKKKIRQKPAEDVRLIQSLREEGRESPTTRLALAAKEVLGRPANLAQLTTTLETRLYKFTYPYPSVREINRTFFEWLSAHGAVETLLSEDVLKEIQNALDLGEIVRIDSQYKEKQKSSHGYSLEFHRLMLEEIHRHMGHVEGLLKQYRVPPDWISAYDLELGRQEIREILALSPYIWPGDRAQIMGSGWALEARSRFTCLLGPGSTIQKNNSFR